MMHCGYFDTTRKGNNSSFLTPTVVCRRRPHPSEICAQSDQPPSKKCRIRQKGSRPWAFQRAIDGVCTLPISPQRVAHKAIFAFLKITPNFNRILKSAIKFFCPKKTRFLCHSVGLRYLWVGRSDIFRCG